MKFPALPVRNFRDATLNFEQLQQLGKTVGMAYRLAAQKVPSAAFTTVKLDTVIKDPGGNFNTTEGWYTVPVGGYYQVSGQTAFTGPAGTEYDAIASVFLSGAEAIRGTRWAKHVANALVDSVVTGIVFCNAGQKIELKLYQASGGEVPLEIGSLLNRLSVIRVA